MADRYRDRLFSADENYARESRSAPQQQPSAPDDPLAELARLIGQADPFSNYGRQQPPAQQSAPQHDAHHAEAEEPAGYEEEPARPSWLQNLASARQAREQSIERQTFDHRAYTHQEPSFDQQPQSYAQDEQHDPRYADPRYADPLGPDPHLQSPDHHTAEPRFDLAPQSGSAPHYERQNFSLPQAPQESEWGQQPLPDSARYDNVLYGQPEHDPNHGTPFAVHDEYGDGYRDQPYDEEEEPPRARRGGTMTVVVVLLLAVVGTAGAFAYRTLVGSPRSGEPPIIKADAGPNKIVPPGQGDSANKQIYDRVGDKSAERMVSREEQPVDVNARTSPRVVFPPLTQNNNPPTVASASPTVRPTGNGVGNGTLGGEEPRKIRTLSIRPGEQDPASAAPAPQARGAAQSAQQRAPAPTTTASTPASNAPVSLAPQAQPPQAAAPKQVASLGQSAGAVAAPGSYVQVSSQKNEADAQASFRALQSKYSGILGSRTATVRRADLGPKGVFYRAMVGPFNSTDEATQFCSSLKSAGGQCVVQRN